MVRKEAKKLTTVHRNRLLLKWARTLRKGTYSQSYGRLNDSSGYCCLGVLCEEIRQQHLKVPNIVVDYKTQDLPSEGYCALPAGEQVESASTYHCSDVAVPGYLSEKLDMTTEGVLNRKGKAIAKKIMKGVLERYEKSEDDEGDITWEASDSPHEVNRSLQSNSSSAKVSLAALNDGGFTFKEIAQIINGGGVARRKRA